MTGPGRAGGRGAGQGRAGPGRAEAGPVAPALWLWRHPRPEGAAGRCIGQTDLAVHRRRAKRLAHRIRATARREGLPREVWTSPLRRCADVGRWLARWGWLHHVDARLMELDFGTWDGQPWSAISWADVQAWEGDFTGHAPGGGEALAAMARRVAAWVCESVAAAATAAGPARPGACVAACASASGHTTRLVVAHAGVMQLLQRAEAGSVMATVATAALASRMCAGLDAARWPRPPGYGELRRCTPGLA